MRSDVEVIPRDHRLFHTRYLLVLGIYYVEGGGAIRFGLTHSNQSLQDISSSVYMRIYDLFYQEICIYGFC